MKRTSLEKIIYHRSKNGPRSGAAMRALFSGRAWVTQSSSYCWNHNICISVSVTIANHELAKHKNETFTQDFPIKVLAQRIEKMYPVAGQNGKSGFAPLTFDFLHTPLRSSQNFGSARSRGAPFNSNGSRSRKWTAVSVQKMDCPLGAEREPWLQRICFRPLEKWTRYRVHFLASQFCFFCGHRSGSIFWTQKRVQFLAPELGPFSGPRTWSIFWHQNRVHFLDPEPGPFSGPTYRAIT